MVERVVDLVCQPVQDAAGAATGVFVHGVDVTERSRRRQELERLAAERGAVLRQLGEGVLVTDPEGRTIYMNDAAAGIFGGATVNVPLAAQSEAYGLCTMDGSQLKLEDMPFKMALEKNLATKGIQLCVRRPDSDPLVIEVNTSPVIAENGEAIGAVAILKDVTDRLTENTRLRAAEEHYRRLVENSPYGIYVLNADGRFQELNGAAARILGRDVDELLGLPFGEIIAPEDRQRVSELFQRPLRDDQNRGLEFTAMRADGGRRRIHIRAAPIVENGDVLGMHGVARDVTDERLREERIRMLATAFEQLDEGISICNAEGEFLFANAAHARLLGYQPGELRNLSPIDFFAGDDPDGEMRDLDLAVEAQGTWSGRTTRRTLDGQDVPVQTTVSRINEQGRALYISIIRDLRAELQHEQKMQRSDRLASLGTLLSGVAHELNNPLHAISNFAELLIESPDPDGDREALEIMRRESQRAANIVRDLQSIAHQTRDVDSEKEMVDLNEVVAHVVKLRRYSLETGSVAVHTHLMPSLPQIWGSRPRLEQAVLNLLGNAEHALSGRHGAEVVVRTSSARGEVLLQISDNGPGIDPVIASRVFDPFFTTKQPGEGTGLGLSQVHSIVEAHGGEVRLNSADGSTTFTLILPCSPGREEEEEDGSRISAAVSGSLRILVVDDEPSIRRSTQRFLVSRGHTVVVAESGAVALAQIEESNENFDVIVSDLRMPGLGGDELLEQLRRRRNEVADRVIFMTGDAASPAARRILEQTGMPVLIKPVSLKELASAVETVAF